MRIAYSGTYERTNHNTCRVNLTKSPIYVTILRQDVSYMNCLFRETSSNAAAADILFTFANAN